MSEQELREKLVGAPDGFRGLELSKHQMIERLVKAGWNRAEAENEYYQMLRDAAEEDGMD